MRTLRSFARSLATTLILLAAACEGGESPLEPLSAEADELGDAPAADLPTADAPQPAALATARWADGYLLASDPTSASYTPVAYLSYNRAGGSMRVTRPAGTTGRYIVTFTGLSALLGNRSTVQVTEYGVGDAYCKPVNGRLVSDKLEVRCFRASTRGPVNAAFSVLVTRSRAGRAFAYAHQPTVADYSPQAAGSYNPVGGMRVTRRGVGAYTVSFTNLGAHMDTLGVDGSSGNVQLRAVGTGKAHCESEEWGDAGTPNFKLDVLCYTPDGKPADSKFVALLTLPQPHVAYTVSNEITAASDSPSPRDTWNPSGGPVTIARLGVGEYSVTWSGIDPEIIEGGNVQVSTARSGDVQCKASSITPTGVIVRCFTRTGQRVDWRFGAMLAS